MDVEQPVIDDTLVRRMVAAQFPQWADFPVRSAAVGGWDNKTFHLGAHMMRALAERRRLFGAGGEGTPLASEIGAFAASSDSNAFGDRRAGGRLSLEVVHLPMDRGRHCRAGAHSRSERSCGQPRAISIALQRIDPTDGPRPGPHNFWRGGSLTTYDAETRRAIALLKGKINAKAATGVWEAALKTTWTVHRCGSTATSALETSW